MEIKYSGFDNDEQIALLKSIEEENNFDYDLCTGRGRDVKTIDHVKNVYDESRTTWHIESHTDRYFAKCDKEIFFNKTKNCFYRGDYFTPAEAVEISDDIIQFYYDQYPLYFDRKSNELFPINVKYINNTWRWKDMKLAKERDRSIYYSKDDNCFVRKLNKKNNQIEEIKSDFVKLYFNMDPFYYDRSLKMLFQGQNMIDLHLIKLKQKVLSILK